MLENVFCVFTAIVCVLKVNILLHKVQLDQGQFLLIVNLAFSQK